MVFDVGATHIRAALAEHGKFSDVVRLNTDSEAAGFASFLGVIEEMSKGKRLSAVAGCMPGQLEGDEGHLALAPNLPNWVGLPVGARIKRLFDCQVSVLNDVELCGLGEAFAGAGTMYGVTVYVTVSTGVNAVRILNGKIDPSIRQFELGKLLISAKGGRPESLETLIGGASLEYRRHLEPRMIHDPAVWKHEAQDLAKGLYDIMLAWTPDIVVFGGGMMKDIDLAAVRAELEQLPRALSDLPHLERAKLGDLGGLHGALVWLGQAKR